MGFSLTGLVIAVAILAPSLLLLVFPPRDDIRQITAAGLAFTLLERAGQLGCLAVLAASPANFDGADLTIWFAILVTCLLVYYGLWIRYLIRGRTVRLLFQSLGFIPIPMAIFPVLAFAAAAAWGRSPWLLAATVVLAIGHLANSWHSATHLDAPDAARPAPEPAPRPTPPTA